MPCHTRCSPHPDPQVWHTKCGPYITTNPAHRVGGIAPPCNQSLLCLTHYLLKHATGGDRLVSPCGRHCVEAASQDGKHNPQHDTGQRSGCSCCNPQEALLCSSQQGHICKCPMSCYTRCSLHPDPQVWHTKRGPYNIRSSAHCGRHCTPCNQSLQCFDTESMQQAATESSHRVGGTALRQRASHEFK
jgi:hypothetical protein